MADAAVIADYMVSPVCAYYWQPLGFLRQQLLLNSFTFLPIVEDNGAVTDRLVSDLALAAYLGREQTQRKARLAHSLKTAIEGGLQPTTTISLPLDTPVQDALARMTGPPVLVVSKTDPARLVGLVTPFDVL